MLPLRRSFLLALAAGAALAPSACGPSGVVAAKAPTTPEGRRVLVIVNGVDIDSVRIGRYYAQKRGVPRENVVILEAPTTEDLAQSDFARTIEAPVQDALAKTKNPIDFLLFVRGVPERIREGGDSVDSRLMSEGLPTQRLTGVGGAPLLARNPYFGSREPFRHARFGIYLACRLDGYTADDAKALVDRALAAKANHGPFLLDEADNRRESGFGELQATLGSAAAALRAKGLETILDENKTFAGSSAPLAGYVSWGSNDGAFKSDVYRSLTFLPGAICETFVSTSGRTFRPTHGGQSLVADLVAQGVTGVKGYVSEPYTVALAKADILLDRYTSGMNLAESFYAASPVTHWKDVVIGDPLCAPYARPKG